MIGEIARLDDFPPLERDTIRPRSLDQFIGQDSVKDRLREPLESAKRTGKPLRHLLLTGGPGLGKTTLAEMLSGELATSFVETTGDQIRDQGSLLKLLLDQDDRGIFLIDEVHLMHKRLMQSLYKAMEDFKFPVVIGKGPSAETEVVQLPRFTLVAATTDTGQLIRPFLDRFKLRLHVSLYEERDLLEIAVRSAWINGYTIDYGAAKMIATRSRGTPRIVNNSIESIIDHVMFYPSPKENHISANATASYYRQAGICELGLSEAERHYLYVVCTRADGGRIGVENIAAAMGEQIDSVKEIEKYPLHKKLVIKGESGRWATDAAYAALNLKRGFQPTNMLTQAELEKIARRKT